MQTKTDDCHPPKYSEQSSVQKRLIRGTKRGKGHSRYTGGASAVRKGVRGTVGTREGLLRYGTGWRARLVHGRGFCGTERDGGHGWYTTMGTGVRNVRKEGFIHKMKPHRSQHAADETGVRRKR